MLRNLPIHLMTLGGRGLPYSFPLIIIRTVLGFLHSFKMLIHLYNAPFSSDCKGRLCSDSRLSCERVQVKGAAGPSRLIKSLGCLRWNGGREVGFLHCPLLPAARRSSSMPVCALPGCAGHVFAWQTCFGVRWARGSSLSRGCGSRVPAAHRFGQSQTHP